MRMRKFAYTAQGDSDTRKTGVADNGVTLTANTKDRKAELFMNVDGKVTLTITEVDVTGPFATCEKGLLQRVIIDHLGHIEYVYNELVTEEVM